MSREPRTVAISHDDGARTEADLTVPDAPVGVVAFAHGSGSSRHSPRNQMVAAALNHRGMATLLVDLLTPAEDAAEGRGAVLRFDVELLARRFTRSVVALGTQPSLPALPIGYFGASTGAAAALIAAAQNPGSVMAVVSRGGRPDLAGAHLRDVRAPTLLLVGGDDETVIEMNCHAQEQLGGPSELILIPGASHLLDEPGTLEQVAQHASDWFTTHLAAARSDRRPPSSNPPTTPRSTRSAASQHP